MDAVYDLIIVGGGPAGLSAAIYAGRSERRTLLLEKGVMAEGLMIRMKSGIIREPKRTAGST